MSRDDLSWRAQGMPGTLIPFNSCFCTAQMRDDSEGKRSSHGWDDGRCWKWTLLALLGLQAKGHVCLWTLDPAESQTELPSTSE